MNDAAFYFYTGIAGALYTGFAALRYYSLSGTQLISAARAKKMIKSVKSSTSWMSEASSSVTLDTIPVRFTCPLM